MSRGTPDTARAVTVSGTGLSPSPAGFPKTFLLPLPLPLCSPLPRYARIPVWAPPVSLAATPGIDVSFSSSGYLDVSVHRVPLHALWIHAWMHEVLSCGFPHSDISGSMDICSSPKLFAAYHVFHRLSVPRHPPCALSCMTSFPASFTRASPPSFRLAWRKGRSLGFFLRLLHAASSDVFPIFRYFRIGFNVEFSRCFYGPSRSSPLLGPVGLSGLEPPTSRLSGVRSNRLSYKPLIRQPPALPCCLRHSTIGRLRLNHRVRDGNGCFPEAHRHRKD